MDYNEMKEIAEELKALSQICDMPLFTIDEELMTAIHMKELKEKRNKESNYGAISNKLTNTVNVCVLTCNSPILETEFTGLKPNTIYIIKE